MKRSAVLAVAAAAISIVTFIILVREDCSTPSLSAHRRPDADAGALEPLPDLHTTSEAAVTLENANDSEAIAIIEGELGELSREEVESKPKSASWSEWFHVISMHRIKKSKNGPVEFFGKVVDVNGNPLSGVSVVAEVLYGETSLVNAIAEGSNSATKRLVLETDDYGAISITALEGSRLVLRDFEKRGYVLVGEKKGWSYSFIPGRSTRHRADVRNPEVFTMTRANQ